MTKTRLARVGTRPIVPINNRAITLPSTYNELAGISLISDAFTTFGCKINVSQVSAISRAAGVASPAWPPISAPIPVGIKNTTLKRPVFSCLRGAKSNMEISERSPSSDDFSKLLITQLTWPPFDFVIANLRGAMLAGNRNRAASRICASESCLSSAIGSSSSSSLKSNSFSLHYLSQSAFNKCLLAGCRLKTFASKFSRYIRIKGFARKNVHIYCA